MIPRELPSYLSVAYSLRFKDSDKQENFFKRIFEVVSQFFQLVKELITYRPNWYSFDHNIKKLDSDFDGINKRLNESDKPICAYFVSSNDRNGAIIGDPLYYYHHYKIQKFQKHFDVAAKVVRSTKEMFDQLGQLKTKYPNREIKVVDIVSHGGPSMIDINVGEQFNSTYRNENVKENEFESCAQDAVIILDACSTAVGNNSIAENIAKKNRGKTVMAPGTPLFFSKPVFVKKENEVTVKNVVHGFAVVNAYTSKKFKT